MEQVDTQWRNMNAVMRFSTASIPRLLIDYAYDIKYKKSSYEMVIQYYSSLNIGENEEYDDTFILAEKQIILSKPIGLAKPGVITARAAKLQDLMITSDHFNEDKFITNGAFMAKQFWAANLLYGEALSIEQNFFNTLAFVRTRYHIVPIIAGIDKARVKIANKKLKALKLQQEKEAADRQDCIDRQMNYVVADAYTFDYSRAVINPTVVVESSKTVQPKKVRQVKKQSAIKKPPINKEKLIQKRNAVKQAKQVAGISTTADKDQLKKMKK